MKVLQDVRKLAEAGWGKDESGKDKIGKAEMGEEERTNGEMGKEETWKRRTEKSAPFDFDRPRRGYSNSAAVVERIV